MRKFLFVLIPQEPRLNLRQLKTIVDIFVGVGMIGFGSVVIPAIVDKFSAQFVVFGMVIALSSWYIAIRLSKKL
ncbi:hypothetical protein KW795_00955 [Candidatus Microgenomates bacterium]|nr:hypothetical protein [Candidatus Microgenomates bacterium]